MKHKINGKKETYDKLRREKHETQQDTIPAINGKKETSEKAGGDKPKTQ